MLVSHCANQDVSGGLFSGQYVFDLTTLTPPLHREVRGQRLWSATISSAGWWWISVPVWRLIAGVGGYVERADGVEEFPLPLGESHSNPYVLPWWRWKPPVADFTVQEKNSRVIHHWGEWLSAQQWGELHTLKSSEFYKAQYHKFGSKESTICTTYNTLCP